MTKNQMIFFCIIISLLGCIGIYIIDKAVNVPIISLNSLDYKMLGEYVEVCGDVDGYRWAGESVIVEVCEDNASVQVFFSPSSFGDFDVEALMCGRICCEGRIYMDEGDLMISGYKIKEKKEE